MTSIQGIYQASSGNYRIRHDPWGYWTSGDTSGTASASITANQAWGYWTQDLGTGDSTCVTMAVTDTSTTGTYWVEWVGELEQRKVSKAQRRREALQAAEEARQRLARQKQYQIEAAEREAKRKVAAEKAEQLLLSHLTPEQEQAWKTNKAFFVTSQSGKRFEVMKGHGGNLHELDASGKKIARYCVHVDHSIPAEDNCLAQTLALRFAENVLLKVANRSPIND